MYSFFRICILRLQKVLLWPKNFFSWKLSIWVSKTRRILCWCWCRLKQMSIKKLEPKNYANFKFFCFCAFFRGFFFLLTFVRGISETKLFWLHFPFQIKFATPFVTHYNPSKKPATVTRQLTKSIDFRLNYLCDFHLWCSRRNFKRTLNSPASRIQIHKFLSSIRINTYIFLTCLSIKFAMEKREKSWYEKF